MTLVDFNHDDFSLRGHANWKARADSAKVAFAAFGGGPYYGYEVGAIDAMEELGILPDALLPGCVGNFVSMYYLMALCQKKRGAHYIDEFSSHGLMHERDYMKAPIPPLFPMRVGAWMRGFQEYFSRPESYQNLFAPELFPDVMTAAANWMAEPTDRNLGLWLRNLSVWHPLTRFALGAYYFAPIGPFGELYDYAKPEGWVSPAIDWRCVYGDDAPVYMLSLLEVGSRDVKIATNCGDHPEFDPVDGRRLASASNLPWLIAETNINGKWYRESAVRDVATLDPSALDALPKLEVMIAVQIMDTNDTAILTLNQGNHDNYALQVTEMIATIGDDDIKMAQKHLADQGRDVEWIVIEAQADATPHWTFENVDRCRREGYAIAKRKMLESPKLKKLIKPKLRSVA